MTGRFEYIITQDDDKPVVPLPATKRNRLTSIPKPGEFVIVPGNPDYISSALTSNVPNVDSNVYQLQAPIGRYFVLDPSTDMGVYFAPRSASGPSGGREFVNGIITIMAWDAMQRRGDVVFREYSGIFDEDSEYYRPNAGRWMKRHVLTPGDILRLSLMAPKEIVPDDSELVLRVMPYEQQTSPLGPQAVGGNLVSSSGDVSPFPGMMAIRPRGFRRDGR